MAPREQLLQEYRRIRKAGKQREQPAKTGGRQTYELEDYKGGSADALSRGGFYGLNRPKIHPEPKSQQVEVLRFVSRQVARSNRCHDAVRTRYLSTHESKHS